MMPALYFSTGDGARHAVETVDADEPSVPVAQDDGARLVDVKDGDEAVHSGGTELVALVVVRVDNPDVDLLVRDITQGLAVGRHGVLGYDVDLGFGHGLQGVGGLELLVDELADVHASGGQRRRGLGLLLAHGPGRGVVVLLVLGFGLFVHVAFSSFLSSCRFRGRFFL